MCNNQDNKQQKLMSILKSKWTLIISLIVIIIATVFLVGFSYNALKEKNIKEQWNTQMEDTVYIDKFYEGIFLDDIPLGGKTMDEAAETFSLRAKEKLDKIKISLVYNDQEWQFDAKDLGAGNDWDEKLEDTYYVARVGTLEDRFRRVQLLEKNGLRINSEITYNLSVFKEKIDAIADSLYIPVIDASSTFFPETEDFVITDEKNGRYVDAELLWMEVEEKINSEEYGTITIISEVLYPTTYAKNLRKATTRIVSFSTPLKDNNPNRDENVRLSLASMNGYMVAPGEVFSFNGTTGRRTIEAGYKMAPVIKPDKSLSDGLGGGICQSSSTLYNAVVMADLLVVERYHHSFPVSYIKAGLDAGVIYGGADVRFKNNRETPIFIKTYIEGRDVFVEIFGEPLPNNGRIELISEITERITALAPKRIEDTQGKYVSKPGGQKVHIPSRNGLRTTSYKIYYENDIEVRREIFTRDFYKPIQGITYYRKAVTPPKEPTPSLPAATSSDGAGGPQPATSPSGSSGE